MSNIANLSNYKEIVEKLETIKTSIKNRTKELLKKIEQIMDIYNKREKMNFVELNKLMKLIPETEDILRILILGCDNINYIYENINLEEIDQLYVVIITKTKKDNLENTRKFKSIRSELLEIKNKPVSDVFCI